MIDIVVAKIGIITSRWGSAFPIEEYYSIFGVCIEKFIHQGENFH